MRKLVNYLSLLHIFMFTVHGFSQTGAKIQNAVPIRDCINENRTLKDVISEHEESLKFKKSGPKGQYKKFVREAVFFIELGYCGLAMELLDQVMETFPNDPEAYYGYSLLFAANNDITRSFDSMLKAMEAGMPLDRFTSGLTTIFDPLLNSIQFKKFIASQNHDLVHGPMLGDVTAHSARFWLRTFGQKPIQVIARPKNKIDFSIRSKKIVTKSENENTAVVYLQGLEPLTTYEYKLIVGDKEQQKIFQFQTFPEKGTAVKFTTGFGGGAGFTPKYEYMWDTIGSHGLPFFMLLGDNVYIDHPERPGTQQYCYYRLQSRPEYRRFHGNTAIYAIWDDHDFTFNDGKGSPHRDDPPWKRKVLNLFQNQWANPYYGGGEKDPGCWFDFSHGDVDFFMLDCRYYREKPKGNPAASMLGKVQKRWLFEKLKSSKATFKVIASSVPWAKGTKPGSLDTWDGHPQEREEIFRFIGANKIEGILLISADRHRSDAWRIERPNSYDLYDLESSKLTNIHTHDIMPGSLFGYNKKCSFGLLEFDTMSDDPKVIYRIMSIDNEEIHRLTIFRNELSFEKEKN